VRYFKSSHRSYASFLAGGKSALTKLKVNGATIIKPLMMILVLSLGGCATTTPLTKTNGAVTDLMLDENYQEIRSASPAVKAWAKKALHYVNDLSYELKRERNK